MSNSFYTHGAFPSTGSAATSASMRAELDLISAGFDKMPTLSGNANKFVVVNSTGTALTQTSVLPAATFTDTLFTIQDDGDNTRKFQFNAGTVTPGATRIYSVPDANTTLVGTDTTQTLTNKTLTSPVIGTIVNTGTLTLPTSTDTLVGRATTDTLTNKTLTSPVIATIVNTGTLTLPTSTDTLVGRATTDTLTNKTLTSPVIGTIVNTGTLTLPTSTDTLVGRATTDTLTNKTLTSPVIGTIVNTGTLTLPTSTDTLVGRATTDTLTNKTLTSPVIATIVNTGTLTLPTSTDTLVGRATTDTLTNKTLGAFTISGTVSGGGNQINNVIIGASTPLAGAFTTLSTTGLASLPSTGRSAAAALTVTNPAFLYGVASTYTDTASSGTIAAMAPFYSISGPTLSTSNVTTYTNAATLYIANAPTAGGSATITNPYSLYVNAGAAYFGGAVTFAGSASLAALTVTSLTNTGLTSGRVVYSTTGGLETDSAGLTFDGTNFATTGTATAAKLIPTGTSVTGNGMYLPAANSVGISTAGTNAVYIDATQNVGIGTNAPVNKLNVVSSDSTNIVGSSTAGITITNTYTGAYGYSSDLIYGIGGGAGSKLAGISGVYTNNTSSTGGALVFYTNTGSSTFTEKMRITSAGDVGIGTTTPSTYGKLGLSVSATASAVTNVIGFQNSAGVDAASLRIAGYDYRPSVQTAIDFIQNSGTNFQSQIAFSNNGGSGLTERMRIDSSGNVGVGTTSPAGLAQKTFTTQVTGTSSVAITVGDYSSTSGSTNTMIESLGQRYDANTSFGGRIGAAFRRSDGTAIPSNASLGYYLFGGQWGTDTSYQQAKLLYSASIVGVAESSFTSASAMSTAMVFATGSTGNAWSTANVSYGTERMRITSAGDVGIGVNAPGVKLDVSGVIRSTGTSAILAFSKRSTGTGDAWGMYSQSGEYNIYDYTAAVSRLVIDTSGNLLVGITSATAGSLIQLSNGIAGTAGASNKISLYYASAASAFGFGIASGQLTYNSGDGAHVFYNGGNTSPVERMRISSTGAVSIVGTLTTGNPSPAVTVYTSGSGTYTVPTGAKYLVVEMVGGGGGGSGSGNLGGPYGGDGTVGGSTTFGTSTAVGGGGGSAAGGGSVSGAGGGYTVGGTSGVGISGGRGWGSTNLVATTIVGCTGGSTPFGCAGGIGTSASANTSTGTANTGGGGVGGSASANQYTGTGGGGGGYVKVVYASPSATYSYAVGAGGAGGAKATGCYYGETGSAGLIIVTAYYD